MPVIAIGIQALSYTETKGPANWSAYTGTWNAGEERYDPLDGGTSYTMQLNPVALSSVLGWYPTKIRYTITKVGAGDSLIGIIISAGEYDLVSEHDYSLTGGIGIPTKYVFNLDWDSVPGDLTALWFASSDPDSQEYTIDGIEFLDN